MNNLYDIKTGHRIKPCVHYINCLYCGNPIEATGRTSFTYGCKDGQHKFWDDPSFQDWCEGKGLKEGVEIGTR